MPNETWQSDFTHYRLTRPDGRPGADIEIITWLDDHSRYALHVTAHHRITAPIVLTTFRQAADQHGIPSIHAHRQRHGLHRPPRRPRSPRRPQRLRSNELRRLEHRPEELPTQPPHHLRQSRTVPTDHEEVAPRPTRPTHHARRAAGTSSTPSSTQYNHRRPHRSLPHRATPATTLPRPIPKPLPGTDRRHRHPRPDPPRHASTRPATSPCASPARLRHIGVGRTHARTRVILLIHDLHDPRRQRHHRRTPPRTHPRPRPRLPAHRRPPGPPPQMNSPNLRSAGPGCRRCLETSHWSG